MAMRQVSCGQWMITIQVQCTCGLLIAVKVGGFKSSGFAILKDTVDKHLEACRLG